MSRLAKLWPRAPLSLPSPMTETAHWVPLRDLTDLCALGAFQRNVFAGMALDLNAEATGTFDLPLWFPIGVDNRNSQLSNFNDDNGGVLKAQFRFLCQVSNAAINVTPKVYDITATALATVSGNVSCAATDDDFSGTNQQQTVVLTIPAALHYFRPKVTIAGTPAGGYTARVIALWDLFIDVDG